MYQIFLKDIIILFFYFYFFFKKNKAIKINDKTKSKDHIYRCGIHLIINWNNIRNLIKIFFNR